MQNLKITMVQADLIWEDSAANLSRFDTLLQDHGDETDLIILPEMFSTGFSMNIKRLAEGENGVAQNWLKKKAQQLKVVLTGSIIVEENGCYYNRLFWVQPDGGIQHYDKRHLFRMADEHLRYTPGKTPLTVSLKGWKVRPFICYDLRFPVWSRNSGNSYDLAIYIANWPERRSDHWRTLLKARAIENQAIVAGVNRVGRDGNGILYRGDSSVFNAVGKEIVHCADQEMVKTVSLNYEELSTYRQKFPVWRDADSFDIKI